MKIVTKSIAFAAVLAAAGCTPSVNRNEAASDTSSVLDTTRLNTKYDTSAVYDVKANGAVQATQPTQYEESNGKQSSRTNVGTDTTGLQSSDNLKDRTAADGTTSPGNVVGGSKEAPLRRERR